MLKWLPVFVHSNVKKKFSLNHCNTFVYTNMYGEYDTEASGDLTMLQEVYNST